MLKLLWVCCLICACFLFFFLWGGGGEVEANRGGGEVGREAMKGVHFNLLRLCWVLTFHLFIGLDLSCVLDVGLFLVQL